jgi:hypothetical protein
MTLEEASAAVQRHLKTILADPKVSLTLTGWETGWQRLEEMEAPTTEGRSEGDQAEPAQPLSSRKEAEAVHWEDPEIDAAYRTLIATSEWRDAQAAAEKLGALGQSGAPALIALTKYSGDLAREYAFMVLMEKHPAEPFTVEAVLRGLADKKTAIAYRCAFHVGEHKIADAADALRKLLDDRDRSELVRFGAAKSLAQLGDRGVLPMLHDGLGRDDFYPRYLSNLGWKGASGKALEDFGHDVFEGTFVSGPAVYKRARRPVEDAELRAKRFQAIAEFSKWLQAERPDLYAEIGPGRAERGKGAGGDEIAPLSEQLKKFKAITERLWAAGQVVGSVVRVVYDREARQLLAYVDLGSADRLPPQITFSVWSADQAQPPGAAVGKRAERRSLSGSPKGFIEIRDVLGPHSSVARVTKHDLTNPIAPGDWLFSPVWKPGEPQRLALAGRFDPQGTGANDRALVIAMIKKQGGIIDAEVQDDGTVEGQISPQTNWLVIGSLPAQSRSGTDATVQAVHEAAQRLRADAQKLAVDIIDQAKLYQYMGWPTGREAAVAEPVEPSRQAE